MEISEAESKVEDENQKLGNSSLIIPLRFKTIFSQMIPLPSNNNNGNIYRCMVCGLTNGLILRCCGCGCHVRAHPICVLFAKDWKMITLEEVEDEDEDGESKHKKRKNSRFQTPSDPWFQRSCFLCSLHSVEVVKSIEGLANEVDYFNK